MNIYQLTFIKEDLEMTLLKIQNIRDQEKIVYYLEEKVNYRKESLKPF